MNKKFLIIIISITSIILLIPLILYFIKFNGVLSEDINDWIGFGTLLSGTVGIAINSITLISLIYDNSITKKENLCNKLVEIFYRQNEALVQAMSSEGKTISNEKLFYRINEEMNDNYKKIFLIEELDHCDRMPDIIFNLLNTKLNKPYKEFFEMDFSSKFKLLTLLKNKFILLKIPNYDFLIHSLGKDLTLDDNILAWTIDITLENNENIHFQLQNWIQNVFYATDKLKKYKEGLDFYCNQFSNEQKRFLTLYNLYEIFVSYKYKVTDVWNYSFLEGKLIFKFSEGHGLMNENEGNGKTLMNLYTQETEQDCIPF